ncbi:AraC family transcriptional regulator [Gilliamella sp. Occ4-3]|uniref:AraC family transcriptional regulator n=1 Tax=Gilliamella sp. Occ4-3 TaxID=3120254 RepID=UPI00080D9F1A|nr:helix-turn-helix transcriptional regulator [Gilliamella apicola]OCG76015.1 AraC family transcriptional regulator [Gilliamella apicola]
MNISLISPEVASSDNEPMIISASLKSPSVKVTELHHHSRGQLAGTLQGLISIEVESSQWVIPATHGIWIPPDTQHSLLGSHGPFHGWSIYIQKSECNNLPNKSCMLELSSLLREAITRTMTWNNSELQPEHKRLMAVIVDEISIIPQVEIALPMPKDIRLLKIALALSNNPSDDRNINEWSVWAGISRRSLTRRFTNETGFNFTEWRQKLRMLKALELLVAGRPITEISLNLGYDNISGFIAIFRRNFGVTPGNYQKAMRNNHPWRNFNDTII